MERMSLPVEVAHPLLGFAVGRCITLHFFFLLLFFCFCFFVWHAGDAFIVQTAEKQFLWFGLGSNELERGYATAIAERLRATEEAAGMGGPFGVGLVVLSARACVCVCVCVCAAWCFCSRRWTVALKIAPSRSPIAASSASETIPTKTHRSGGGGLRGRRRKR